MTSVASENNERQALADDAASGKEVSALDRQRWALCHRAEFAPAVWVATFHLAATIAALAAAVALTATIQQWWRFIPSLLRPMVLIGLTLGYGLTIFRTFVIAHDCVHGSFYPSRRINQMLGALLSWVTLTPTAGFAKNHLRHHREANRLGATGKFNHTVWYTVAEYEALARGPRLAYRLLRQPLFFFGVVPLLNWLRGLLLMQGSWQTLIAAGAKGVFFYYLGSTAALGVWVGAYYVFNALTIFGVHIQHTFNPAYCRKAPAWGFSASALQGSSYHTTLGCGWFFLGVEHHALHHFAPHVPVYRLRRCYALAKQTLWKDVRYLRVWDLPALVGLTLYSDQQQAYVSFASARRRLVG